MLKKPTFFADDYARIAKCNLIISDFSDESKEPGSRTIGPAPEAVEVSARVVYVVRNAAGAGVSPLFSRTSVGPVVFRFFGRQTHTPGEVQRGPPLQSVSGSSTFGLFVKNHHDDRR